MKTIEFLKNNSGNFAQLTDTLGIKVKTTDAGFVLLDYCQINSPKTDPIVRECRGLILDADLNVVCRSFDRFFNLGEADVPESSIDENNLVIAEKVDGSLIRVWYAASLDQWVISTRGTVFADSDVHGNPMTFSQLFDQAFANAFGSSVNVWFNRNGDPGFTYVFEVATPFNRVVTPYSTDRVALLAVRNNSTGKYWSIEQLNDTGLACVEYYPVMSIDAIKATAAELPGLQEGFVLYAADTNAPLCKVKSPQYLVCHRIKGEGLNPRRIAELVWMNEQDEYLAYFPEDRKYFEPYTNARVAVVDNINATLAATAGLESQKEFAMAVKDLPIASIMFNLRKGKSLADSLSAVSDPLPMLRAYMSE